MAYWLFKTEPDAFSIDDLKSAPAQTTAWEGVRNYQARNFMREGVKLGDLVMIYHSSCKHVGVAGIAIVTAEAYPDPCQFDLSSDYYDPKSTCDKPRWVVVDVTYQQHLNKLVSLKAIKENDAITEIALKKGGRLSVMPVTKADWQAIIKMAE
ncbi:EVE domain-containing protein [Pseudoalteromonas sp. SR44-5]|uniref:EVE domain-containing protein n=1 Tax=Pseudoalteromonas TaxID=53246 RepID=UPI001602F3A6|nr:MULTISPECIES: EVE domain-containing protein [unclassified Pseudoalteromonas]MBB1334206.1 EVE domain-containing protein [Pseudoalteromonas sp. SR41-6]MBB1341890.1 EVE domain-containing protein [Pseudoalteromonas sp. SR45-6]MBB1367322.1 EVE domain-containing protein [Pseudoalteromonas sp. SR44-5]MBB1418263.1 EVE domain-containing protein [Pseudoalteromonas sp. SG44-1]MBB1433808.1 EVE domain-containing protein [Pseudoalteromonas sp. SG43-6]